MTVWMRNVAAVAVALTLGLGTVGCDDDEGFGLALQIFFNLVGSGQYSSVTATVDLSAAQSVIDPDTCELSAELQNAGCNISIAGAPSGSTTTLGDQLLEITLSGCTVDAFTSLANCLLQSGSVSDIQNAIVGSGVCAPGSACDTSPLICVSSKGPDDFCGNGPTTTTSTAPTTLPPTTSTSIIPPTTSSTTTSTTSTTIGGGPIADCQITFGVTNTATIGALSWDVDYSGSGGNFQGSGSGAECITLAGDFAAYNNCDTPGGCPPLAFQELSTAIISSGGFNTPADVSRCHWIGNGVPAPGAFGITVTDASDPSFNPTTAVIAVTDVTCTVTTTTGGVPTTTVTTTSSTSSTSISGPTTTNTAGGPPQFAIQINLGNTSGVSVGALGFVVDYSSAPGDFVGSGADIASGGTLQCTRSAGDFGSFNDNDAGTLNAAYVSLGGFQGPTQLAICNFEQTGASAPVAGDFVITVTDASQPNLNPISPLPVVSIGTILPLP